MPVPIKPRRTLSVSGPLRRVGAPTNSVAGNTIPAPAAMEDSFKNLRRDVFDDMVSEYLSEKDTQFYHFGSEISQCL
jgi:hypothetical protein